MKDIMSLFFLSSSLKVMCMLVKYIIKHDNEEKKKKLQSFNQICVYKHMQS